MSEIKKGKVEVPAKKDFVINHNEFHLKIKKGDELKDVPKIYWPNLKTEGVM